MKKKILVLTVVLALAACSTTKNTIPNTIADTPENTSLDIKAEVKVKGNWTLTKVSYPGSEYLNVVSFQLADSKCLIGSQWNFISNNNKGTMTIKSANCTEFSSPIVWSINKDKKFSLKILQDAKARVLKTGFYLLIQNQTDNSFELIDKMNVGGKMTDITYNFEKNN